mmetsp:Transcript_21200/g.52160  ORF Transcript_21200/g.52160 Transcript_21200/m.52160 type:complete len:359 (-) Transcript_21200:29-1105(-)
MPKTNLSGGMGRPAMKESSIEMSDWNKATVQTDGEAQVVGYNFDENDGWMKDRGPCSCKGFLYCLIVSAFIGACVGVYFAVDSGLIAMPGAEADSVEEIVELKNCSMEHHAEWYQKPITKQDGQQYTAIDQIDHDPSSFTQGLTFANGVLYESTGLFKQSKVRILDPNSSKGDVLKSVDMDPKLFGEGMTVWHDKLVQITWKSKRGFIYDIETLEILQDFKFETTNNEGWGITFDWCKNEFIVTDGSPYLHFWDTATLKETRKIKAHRLSGDPAKSLNEIEYWRGRILANVWFEDVLLVINPETGETEKEYDFSMLWPEDERKQKGADVFNGISISDDEDILYVTGKLWNRIHSVKLN